MTFVYALFLERPSDAPVDDERSSSPELSAKVVPTPKPNPAWFSPKDGSPEECLRRKKGADKRRMYRRTNTLFSKLVENQLATGQEGFLI